MSKLKGFLKKYWLVIIFIFIIVVFLLTRKEAPPPLPSPVPIPFVIKNIYPPQGQVELAFPTTAIQFNFSTPVDKNSISIIIDPFIGFEFSLENNDRTLYVQPSTAWKFGETYKIKLSVKSTKGQSLPSLLEYEFTPQIPTDSPLTE